VNKRTIADHLRGQRVRVYRNLYRNCYSVQDYVKGRGWRVSAHVRTLELSEVEFKVNENGRQKVLRDKAKNVHAYVIGTLGISIPLTNGKRVTYNPYKYTSFVDMEENPVHGAEVAQLIFNGKRSAMRVGDRHTQENGV